MTQDLEIIPVKWIEEVLDIALERPLPQRADKVAEGVIAKPSKSRQRAAVSKH